MPHTIFAPLSRGNFAILTLLGGDFFVRQAFALVYRADVICLAAHLSFLENVSRETF